MSAATGLRLMVMPVATTEPTAAPEGSGWVRIERASGDVVTFGPYPSVEAAEHAMEWSALIDAECQADATDCWADGTPPAAADPGRVVVDVTDPDHTGEGYPLPA